MTDVILRGYRSPLKAEDLTGSIYSFDTEEYYEKFQVSFSCRPSRSLETVCPYHFGQTSTGCVRCAESERLEWHWWCTYRYISVKFVDVPHPAHDRGGC